MVIALAGIPICGLVARLVVPIRVRMAGGSSSSGARVGIVSLVFIRRMPESPRWLAAQGRSREADAVMQQIEAEVEAEKGPLPAPQLLAAMDDPAVRLPWTTIFSPLYLGRTMTLWSIWILQTLGFYGFQAWVPTLLVKNGITVTTSLTYVTLINLGAVPGALLAVYLSEKVERKYLIASLAALIAVCGLLYGTTMQPVLIVIFGFAVAMLIQTFASICYAYTPEQYPTEVRNTGSGFAYGAGRVANVANAFVIGGIYGAYGYIWVFVYIAAAWTGCATVALLFGARTRARPLEALSPLTLGHVLDAQERPPSSV